MVLISDSLYNETRQIKIGNNKLNDWKSELSKWLQDRYSICMLNADISEMESSHGRYRLYIILDNTEDYNKTHIDRFRINTKYQMHITTEFLRIAKQFDLKEKDKLENLFVTFNDFSDESRTKANWSAVEEANQILKDKFSDIWHIEAVFSSSIVFFFKDMQVKANLENKSSDKIRMDYYRILKKYDEMNYWAEKYLDIKFDSKENLDKNYEGSLFYYTR